MRTTVQRSSLPLPLPHFASRGRATPSPARSRGTNRDSAPRRDGRVERDALLAQHVGLVHHVARQLASRLSTAVDLDELTGAGALGLVQAVDAFDATRGLSFSTFAVPRIRGAMLDELRRMDHASRNVRRRSRTLARAREVLGGVLQRQPTLNELAHCMQVPATTIRQWELDAAGAAHRSIQQPLRDEPGMTLGEALADDQAVSVEECLTREQEVAQLHAAIARLNGQERTVLALNYFEELKLQQIATVLGLSVCRISQIRTAALAKLRAALSDLRAA